MPCRGRAWKRESGGKKIKKNQQNLSNQWRFFFCFVLRVSLCKKTLACNLATETTTESLVAHIPDTPRNV